MKLVLLAVLATVLGSAPAFALDSVDLAAKPAAEGDNACPALTQVKYPWLVCKAGAHGAVSLSTRAHEQTWENTRNIPRGFDFTEGDGYWGPALNPR